MHHFSFIVISALASAYMTFITQHTFKMEQDAMIVYLIITFMICYGSMLFIRHTLNNYDEVS